MNGHGPYRFLLDTGTNVDLIEVNLAGSIGLTSTFRTQLASSTGLQAAPGADGIEVAVDSVKEELQRFLFLPLDAIQHRWSDVQGVLGQWFLSRLDYTIDLQGKRVTFAKEDRSGTHVPFRMTNGRLSFSTSLGDLVLDSGADRLVLFGVRPDTGSGIRAECRTVAGSRRIGTVSARPLIIDGRKIRTGDAVALPNRTEPGVDGLLPVNLFKAIYVCNSEGYVIFE